MNLEQFILALTIWREARGEAADGWRAVYHVILNRVAARLRGRSILAVCTWPLQFSSMTAKGDPQTVAWPDSSDPSWNGICSLVMTEAGPDPTQGAVYYYAVNIPPPSWADQSKFTVQIGKHRFFRQ